MDQQDKLEAEYRKNRDVAEIPRDDPFPVMIVVCVGITMFLLIVIMGFLFVDFIMLRPNQNVRPTPVLSNPTPTPPKTASLPPEFDEVTLNP